MSITSVKVITIIMCSFIMAELLLIGLINSSTWLILCLLMGALVEMVFGEDNETK